MSTAQVVTAPVRVRSSAIDAVRGLAVALMIADHLSILAGLPLFRVTGGRLAMPLFFLLAGSLAGRLHWRHGWVAVLGLLLPVLVGWVDSPNVLLLWAAGSVVLWGARRLGVPLWVVAGLGLTVAANRWSVWPGGYEPLCLLSLMAVGAMMGRGCWSWGDRLPRGLVVLGRWPLTVYVGHLLVLQAFVTAAGVVVR